MDDVKSADLVRVLHQLILRAAPAASYFSKYGGALYTVKPKLKESHFCGVFVRDDHIELEFRQGAALRDPDKLLNGRGHSRRHIKFYKPDDFDLNKVLTLLKRAAAFSSKD